VIALLPERKPKVEGQQLGCPAHLEHHDPKARGVPVRVGLPTDRARLRFRIGLKEKFPEVGNRPVEVIVGADQVGQPVPGLALQVHRENIASNAVLHPVLPLLDATIGHRRNSSVSAGCEPAWNDSFRY
jgi:hypothetical protein